VADQVAIAVENARLYEGVMRLHEETQERLRHTETLLAVSQDASATLELNEILRRTTRAMVRALGADTGGAWLQSEDGARFVPIVGYHVPKELLGALESASIKSLDPRVSDWRRVEGHVYSRNSKEATRFKHPIAQMLTQQSDPVPADPVDQSRRYRRARGQHRPRDQQPADERARLRLVSVRAGAARMAVARRAQSDRGGSGTRARHRAGPLALQSPARVHPADHRSQHGPRADPGHGPPPGRAGVDHAARGLRAGAGPGRDRRPTHQAGVPQP